jgi:WD40-like Beta Propeller Repeat
MKNLIFNILLISATLNVSAQSLLEKGNKEYELKLFPQAIESFEKLPKAQKNNEITSKLAEAYRLTNKIAKANNQYKILFDQKVISNIEKVHYIKTLVSARDFATAHIVAEIVANDLETNNDHWIAYVAYATNTKNNTKSNLTVKPLATNSLQSDFGASFYKNNIVFSSTRTDLKRRKLQKNTTNQLFILKNGKAEFFKSELKSIENEGLASFTQNGENAVFCINNIVEGIRQIPSSGMQMQTQLTQVQENNWINTTDFQYNSRETPALYTSISPDGNTIFFSSNRQGTIGGFDIFYCKKVGNNWSEPINAGALINSPGDEITPYFNGQQLYFASDYHLGFGGFDIFQSKSKGLSFDKPENMGSTINSNLDDYGFQTNPNDKSKAVFTSNKGIAQEDIFTVDIIQNVITIKVIDNLSKKPIAYPTILLSNNTMLKGDKNGKVIVDNIENLKDIKGNIASNGYDKVALGLDLNQDKKEIVISLSKSKDVAEVKGLVVDYVKSIPLQDVLVTATNTKTNEKIECNTDNRGVYALKLINTENYKISFSKIKYVNNVINITANPNKFLNILELKPSDYSEPQLAMKTEILSAKGKDADKNITRTVETVDIKLGGFKSVKWINEAELKEFGKLTKENKDKITVIYINDVDKNKANEIIKKLKAKGFKDAKLK